MKIAVAKEGCYVSGHFGHCEGFEIFDVKNGKIEGSSVVSNPGHRPGFLPAFLAEKGVEVIISGGMGTTAQELFKQNGINVIVGVQGKTEDVVNQYVKGELESSGHVCEEHMHHGHCGE